MQICEQPTRVLHLISRSNSSTRVLLILSSRDNLGTARGAIIVLDIQICISQGMYASHVENYGQCSYCVELSSGYQSISSILKHAIVPLSGKWLWRIWFIHEIWIVIYMKRLHSHSKPNKTMYTFMRHTFVGENLPGHLLLTWINQH